MTKSPLNESRRYRNFMSAKDRAAEKLLSDTLVHLSHLLNQALLDTDRIVSHRYPHIRSGEYFTRHSTQTLEWIEKDIDQAFTRVSHLMVDEITRLRSRAYILSKAASAEALGQATGKPTKVKIEKDHLARLFRSLHGEKLPDGTSVYNRVRLSLNRVKRKIVDALEHARVREEPLDQALLRLHAAYPKVRIQKAPPKKLRALKEAEKEKGKSFSEIEVDDESWDDLVESYKTESLPEGRFFNEPIDEEGDIKTYNWELEQVTTYDFVNQVRTGEIDAAKENGVTDFVFIAVIDNKTDECCAWRNGLTISEIESELGGDHEDDECQGITPPLHFNCRCQLAPVGDLPDRVESNLEEFDEWLTS